MYNDGHDMYSARVAQTHTRKLRVLTKRILQKEGADKSTAFI